MKILLKIVQYFLTTVFVIYSFIASVFILKYNYDYAKDNSFSKWLLFGQIVPSAQGLIWPYYVFHAVKSVNTSDYIQALTKFELSIYFMQQAQHLQDSAVSANRLNNVDTVSIINASWFPQHLYYCQQAFYLTKMVDVDELSKLDADLPAHYNEEFIKGLQCYLSGYVADSIIKHYHSDIVIDSAIINYVSVNSDYQLVNEGSLLLSKFFDYYQLFETKIHK